MEGDRKKKASKFFDTMCEEYLEDKMMKYIDMERLEKDFVDGILQTKTEWDESKEKDNEMPLFELIIDNVPFWFNCFDGSSKVISEAEQKIEDFVREMK